MDVRAIRACVCVYVCMFMCLYTYRHVDVHMHTNVLKYLDKPDYATRTTVCSFLSSSLFR